jgi:hypothetical protein
MEITPMKTRHALAAACAALLFGACDAGTGVDETAELETGTETMVLETEPMTDPTTTMGEEIAFAAVTLADLDTDTDRQVSREEYDTWFDQEVWNEWGGDQQVGSDEFGDTWWMLWDENADDAIDQQEYQRGTETFAWDGVTYPDFATAAGDDQRWTRDELDPWFEENVWSTWDTDSDTYLTRDEAADTWWDLWDGNDDDMIDDQELGRFGGGTEIAANDGAVEPGAS